MSSLPFAVESRRWEDLSRDDSEEEEEAEDSNGVAPQYGRWSLTGLLNRPIHVSRNSVVVAMFFSIGIAMMWWGMDGIFGPQQVSVFVPQGAMVSVPGTNYTFEARPAAFGPLLSDFRNVTYGPRVRSSDDSSALAIMRRDSPDATSEERLMDYITTGLMAAHGEYDKTNTWQSNEQSDFESYEAFDDIPAITAPLKVVSVPGCDVKSGAVDLRNSIALVERGECSFYDKILVLQQWGAVGVIVGNNAYRRGLVTMYTEYNDHVYIPSVFVSKESYDILATVDTVSLNAVDLGSSVIGTVIFLMVSPLCSLSLIYCVLLFHRRYKRMQERASKKTVAKLPTRIWVQPTPRSEPANQAGVSVEPIDGETTVIPDSETTLLSNGAAEGEDLPGEKPWVSSGECIICMDDYVSGVSHVMCLPCYHEFHVDCITRWLTTRKKTCPICKYDVTLGKRPRHHEDKPAPSPASSTDVSVPVNLTETDRDRDLESCQQRESFGDERTRLLEDPDQSA